MPDARTDVGFLSWYTIEMESHSICCGEILMPYEGFTTSRSLSVLNHKWKMAHSFLLIHRDELRVHKLISLPKIHQFNRFSLIIHRGSWSVQKFIRIFINHHWNPVSCWVCAMYRTCYSRTIMPTPAPRTSVFSNYMDIFKITNCDVIHYITPSFIKPLQRKVCRTITGSMRCTNFL